MILMLPVAGCMNVPSADAICDGTRQARTDHAAALVADGGPFSLVTGQRLISRIDAGCNE
jgi:hypothetical protein